MAVLRLTVNPIETLFYEFKSHVNTMANNMGVIEEHLQRKIQEKNLKYPVVKTVLLRQKFVMAIGKGKKNPYCGDTLLTPENPRSLMTFQSKSFLARQMSEGVAYKL